MPVESLFSPTKYGKDGTRVLHRSQEVLEKYFQVKIKTLPVYNTVHFIP
ncbi:MAG: hypothetical protein ACFFD4_26785 [Candidatus Odinarchaeota archaeon]